VRAEYSIGRREQHSIRLTERNISRDHARLIHDALADHYVMVISEGHNSGTRVNGAIVANKHVLRSGDVIELGDYRLEIIDEQEPNRLMTPTPTNVMTRDPTPMPPAAAADKPHRLVQLTCGEFGHEYVLERDSMLIGRAEGCDIQINHFSVSRHHCIVHMVQPGIFEVADQNSANGIRVAGKDLRKALLEPGDVLELGDVQLKFVPAGQAFVFDPVAALNSLRANRVMSTLAFWGLLAAVLLVAAFIGVWLGHASTARNTPADAVVSIQAMPPTTATFSSAPNTMSPPLSAPSTPVRIAPIETTPTVLTIPPTLVAPSSSTQKTKK
jgi:pSer/pThr/pTyr-binding forkhead associated (FHA) protein